MSASSGQLTKIAVCLAERGVSDRGARLAVVAAVIGHEVSSTKELTAAEAHAVIEQLEHGETLPGAEGVRRGVGCGRDGLHWLPPGEGRRACRCGGVVRLPPVKDRSCPPAICYCGSCPYYVPSPPVNYPAAIAALREREARKAEYKAKGGRRRR